MSRKGFGYGSRVHKGTLPPHLAAVPVTVRGWRRAWRAPGPTAFGGACAVSVWEHEGASIDGLLITISDDVWPQIVAREHKYEPLPLPEFPGAVIFKSSPEFDDWGSADYPVCLTYIDTIVGGMLDVFGPSGVEHFFATTDGWHVPIIDDRDAPLYPRHQPLSAQGRTLVDQALRTVDATVHSLEERHVTS